MTGVFSGELPVASHQVPSLPSDGLHSEAHFQSSQSRGLASSFRVENRRARPKIVQNVIDQGNAFFSKQANILHTSQKRQLRGIS